MVTPCTSNFNAESLPYAYRVFRVIVGGYKDHIITT